MDYKKTNAPTNTVTRDMIALSEPTGNVYETVYKVEIMRYNKLVKKLTKDIDP